MRLSDFIPPIITNLFTLKETESGNFYVFNSSYDPWKGTEYLKNYGCIPELNAIINLRANAKSNGRFKVIDDNGTEYPNEPILVILKNPNWFQAGKEFMKQTSTFHDIFGNEYVYGYFGIGASWDNVKAIYTLPPNLVDAEYKDAQPFFNFRADEKPKIKYTLNSDGKESDLDTELMIHLNDNRADIKSVKGKRILKGESKQKALTPVLNNIKLAYESRGVILESRGANGALTPEVNKDGMGANVPMNEPELAKVHSIFKEKYGTRVGQRQIIISPQALRWVQMGTNNPKNLGLYEEMEEDFRKIQDAYGVPPELFARPDGSTYENQNQARKGLYTETVIPEQAEWCAGLSKRVYPDGKKRIIQDFMHLPIFQEDMKIRGDAMDTVITALSKAMTDNAITIDDYKNELKKFGLGKSKK